MVMNWESTTLAKRFIHARENIAKISQPKLAKDLGCSQQAIQKIESNITQKSKYLYDASRIMGVQYDWLLSGVGEIIKESSQDEWTQEARGRLENLREEERKIIDNAFEQINYVRKLTEDK